MCGFLGQFSKTLAPQKQFLDILAIAQHRGPDQQGYWAEANIQLGFNRLAILDLTSAGHQPMHSQAGNWVIVFNGEIYNHLEIRKQLNTTSYAGHSDTETITASLEEIGFEATVKNLVGMFAIAAYHKKENKLYIARDAVGIKPFFYANNPENFWFASQFDQVIKGVGKQKLQILPEGMRDFLQFGYMQAPNTIYKGIVQLEPGQMAVIDGTAIHTSYFQQYPAHVSASALNDRSHAALEEFNQLFDRVCKDQLHADVPVSTFLSSGIDSTLVTAFAHKHKADLTAYTIGVNDSESDERPLAAAYADILGVHFVSKSVDANGISKHLSDHFSKMGEPFGDFSSLPTYLICKSARENSTVMLGGDGGDELFWGYPRFYNFTQSFPFYKNSLASRRVKKKLKVFRKPSSNAVYEFHTPDEMVQNAHSHIPLGWVNGMLPGVKNTANTEDLYSFYGKNQKEFRNWLRYNEFYAHMQRVLIKVDRMSMAHSLEVRVPLLDQRIVEFAWQLESDFGLTSDGTLKPFLKKVLAQYIPKETINQNKKGFYIPIADWLKGELRDEALHLLLNEPVLGEEYIDRKVWNAFVSDFFEKGQTGKEWGIWIMYAWQKWKQHLETL